MTLNYTFFWGAGLLALWLIFRLLGKKAIVGPYRRAVQAFLYGNVLLLLSLHFYGQGQWMGVLAVLLGGVALGKYFWDMQRG